jgi:predicted TIM-barrel fold metal-dependent hydrolase
MYSFGFSEMLEFEHSPIDIHSHFNHGSRFDCPEDESHLRNFAFLESVYAKAGVSQVGMSTFASVLNHVECITEENRYLHKLIDEKDWVYQWVVIDPRQKETYEQAEKMLSHPKVLGIKIQSFEQKYDIREYADELFSFANQHKTVILMHPHYISQMPQFADQYPDMKLIIAHLASKEHVDAVANAKHGNIYTDTSGGASSRNHIVEYAVSRIGSQKILFGTDTYSFAFQFGRIALSDLSLQDKENILWKNAQKLFPALQTQSYLNIP